MPGGEAFTLKSSEEMDAKYAYLDAMEGRATRWACDGGVEYRPGSGSWPVVLSAPHGGDRAPESLPDRTDGCNEPDERTYELADVTHASFSRNSRGSVALVALRLHRRKCDANRCQSASGHAAAWAAYHGFLEEALAECVRAHGFALLVDLHGQSHREGMTECGYLLTAEDLTLTDAQLDAKPPRETSLDAFRKARMPGSRLARLVRGEGSLGGRLTTMSRHEFTEEAVNGIEGAAFPCTPSHEHPVPVDRETLAAAKLADLDVRGSSAPPPKGSPGAKAAYFHGGFSCRRYGAPATVLADKSPLSHAQIADWGSDVAAVQLELAWAGCRECHASRRKFGKKLKEDVRLFLWEHAAWIYKSKFIRPDPAFENCPPPPMADFDLKSHLSPAYVADPTNLRNDVPRPVPGERLKTRDTDLPRRGCGPNVDP